MLMNSDNPSTTNLAGCRRCGTCCRKGGPGLHLEDQPLVDSGRIPLKHLLTLRQGEPVYDNVTGNSSPAVTDILKVKGIHQNTTVCVFYETSKKSCRIYGHRPIECEALKCWDTRRIEAVYNCRRLTRRHLISKIKGLWGLVEDHQQRCDYGYIAELVARIRQNHKVCEATDDLLELIRYDQHLRDVTMERTHLESGILTFLFGRPLSSTIKLFRIQMNKTEQGITFEPTGPTDAKVCYRRNGF
jgi:Fe-S-cluster containining protein